MSDQNILALQAKLNGLSQRLVKKDELGKQYKKIVSDSLARIKAKLTKVLTAHNTKIQEIKNSSEATLTQTRNQLQSQLQEAQTQSRAALEAANQAATQTRNELQNNLNNTNAQLANLQAELQRPNPDTQNMQVIIEKLRIDAKTASEAANNQIAQLTQRLTAYDGLRDKMDALIQQLLDKVGDILAQVDAMSINQEDITELLQLLKDTENLIPNDDNSGSGSDDEGGIMSRFFGTSSGKPAAGAGPPLVIANRGRTPSLEARQPRSPNSAPGQQGETAGGKTKRRRGKKTKHRGGYVNKPKSATRKRHKRPRTSRSHSRRSSRRSSPSSSSV